MSEVHIHPVKENILQQTHADNDTYLSMYQESVNDPQGFLGQTWQDC